MRAFIFWFFALTGLISPVIVHCAPISITWSSPANDLSATGQRTASEQIALSADGKKATAVWTRGTAGSNQIVQTASAIISGNSASWSTPTDLSVSGAYRAQVAVSSDGTRAIVVWDENPFIKCRLATISGNSASWGASFTLSSVGTNGQVALSSDGTRATAVWLETTGTKSRSATIIGNSAVWGVTNTLSNSGQSAQGPQVSLSKDGSKATAVWIGIDAGSTFIQASSATIVGDLATWASPFSLTVPSLNPVEQVEVALSDEGDRATVVWSKKTSSGPPETYVVQSVSATIVGSSASWGSVLDLSSTSNTRLGPKVSLSGDGTKATAIWRTIPTGTNGIIQTSSATIQGNSASWATPISLSPAGEDSSIPDVKVSSNGSRATAIWHTNSADDTPPRPDVMQASSAEIIGSVASWSAVIDVSSNLGIGNTRLGLSSDGTIAAAIWKGTYDLTQGNLKSVTQSAIALIVYPSPVPQPIPTLLEGAQIMMMLAMIATAGLYGWRMKQS